jgi:hypothetical protein
MMFVSVLLKTYGVVLLPMHAVAAAVCWAVSLAADLCWARRGNKTFAAAAREVIFINLAAGLIGAAIYAFHIEATIRWKDGLLFPAHAAALLLKSVGFQVAAFDGILHATTMAGILQFPVDLDRLGILPPLLFAGFGLLFLLAASPDWTTVLRETAWIAAVVFVAMLARWVLATSCFLFLTDFIGYETEELPVLPFFKPDLTAALYLPFLLAAAVILHRRFGGLAAPAEGERRRLLPSHPWIGALLIVLLTAAWWEPAGSPKEGEVVINTYHANWSRTDRAYDREWYGPAAGYNYACMKRLFERFYPTRELTTRITAEALETASVLVLYDPDRALTQDEIRAIHAFVERGGGILLVGDHTNVFGTTSHLNSVCGPFGFFFRDDVLFDLDTDFFQLYDVPRAYTGFMHGMDFFKFRGPASIQPTSWFTRTVFRVPHAKSLRAIYSVNNFYPPPHDHPKMRVGDFAVSVASRYGRGRVLAFADSTVFSNFEIFYPGKYEYLLNGIHWLDHADAPFTTPLKRLALLGALLLLAVQLRHAGHPRRVLGTLLAAYVAGVAGWGISRAAEQAHAELPLPEQPTDFLFFATDPDDPPYTLRTFVTDSPYDQKYDVFFQWVLRADIFSGFYLVGPGQENGLHRSVSESDRARTGMALIVRQPEHLELLEELGPGPLSDADPLLLLISSSSTNLNREAVMASLEASRVLDESQRAEVAAAWPSGELRFEDGERRIAVVLPAEKYCDINMGITEKVTPTETQLALYQEQFALLDWLYGRESAD